jgi:protease-4
MKDFLKIVLASVLGFLIAQIILFFIAMIMFVGAASSFMGSMTSDKFILQENSVLNLKLSGTIVERTAEPDPFTSMLGSDYITEMGLNDIVSAIRKAKNNNKIKGIYIDSRSYTAGLSPPRIHIIFH